MHAKPDRKEPWALLPLSLGGLGICLACATAYLAMQGAGEEIAGRMLRLNISLAHQVLNAQVALQNYLTTGEKTFLSQHRSAMSVIPPLAGELEGAGQDMAIPDSMLPSATKHLVEDLQEWKVRYAILAIQYKQEKLANSRSSRLARFVNKGVGTQYSRNVEQALASVKGHVEQSLTIHQSRLTNQKRWLAAGALLGLILAAGFGYLSRREGLARISDLRRRSAQSAGLAAYVERIQHLASVDQTARLLVSAVKPQAAEALVLLLAKGEARLRIAASEGGLPEGSNGSPMLDDPDLCPVMRTGQRFVIHDVAAEPVCNCPLGVPRTGGYACSPLTAQGRVTGLVNLKSKPGRLLIGSELDHAQALARVTSIQLSQLYTLDSAKHEATTDQLTAVFNRRFLDGYLEKQLQAALRQSHPLAALMLDLDRFKSFNDRHGHQAGDILLKSFAHVLTDSVREGDLVARYGGEEFTVVLPNTARPSALEIAERIRAGVETMHVPELAGIDPPVITVSIGLAMAPEQSRHAAGLISAADAALYDAKETGRNRIVTALQPLPQISS